MEGVHSASIDPPEPIVARDCPLHGSERDPDDWLDEKRDLEWHRQQFPDLDDGW